MRRNEGERRRGKREEKRRGEKDGKMEIDR